MLPVSCSCRTAAVLCGRYNTITVYKSKGELTLTSP